MGGRARREVVRRALYAPGANDATVARYRALARRGRYRTLAAVAVAAAVLVVLLVSVPRPAPVPVQTVGPAVRGAIRGPEGFPDLAAATQDLPRSLATLRDSGRSRVVLSLDRFGEVVERDSRIVVLVRCSGGAFRLRLSSVTQGRSQILLEPLTTARGACGGVQRVRYRPLLGLLPTAVEVDAAGPIALEARITGTP